MGKKKNEAMKPYRERLQGTPFKSAAEMTKAQQDCLMDVWKELEYTKNRLNLYKKPEYEIIVEQFRKGLVCAFGENNENLFRAFIDEEGYKKVHLNEKLLKKLEIKSQEISYMIKSISELFFNSYDRSIGIVPKNVEPVPNKKPDISQGEK